MKVLAFLLIACFAVAGTNDARLKEVHTVFVTGNNQAAEKIRSEMRRDTDKGKGCMVLVTNADKADATFDVATDSNLTRNAVMRERDWLVNGTLTTKAGDIIWSSHAQFSDAPMMSGGDIAGQILYRHLRADACGK